jgi:hypothetical protein
MTVILRHTSLGVRVKNSGREGVMRLFDTMVLVLATPVWRLFFFFFFFFLSTLTVCYCWSLPSRASLYAIDAKTVLRRWASVSDMYVGEVSRIA